MIAWRVFPTAVPIAPEMSCVTLAWPTVVSRSAYAKMPKIAANAAKLSAAFFPGPQEGFGWWAGEPSCRSARVIHVSSIRYGVV
ncbi:hypothetical protein [Burkholderia contaminans]|uniref:hypothetical protein n=1 Tax=Burkholderia contaminans TaxID=488447 RepID=UPI002D7FD925|nr:hypothetical protein [Burkholderia contaminans]